ncbi:MAG TPA: hypothetical protein V6D16_22230 [Candidatus Obscuribacterales bacterium]
MDIIPNSSGSNLSPQPSSNEGLQIRAAAAIQLETPFLKLQGRLAFDFKGFDWIQTIKRFFGWE